MDSLSTNQSFVEISTDGTIRIRADSVAEAKIAIKELKLKKKELGITKREITNQQQQIRASYTEDTRKQGSKFRGGGGIGKFVRSVQTASRDAARANLANQLAPLDKQKNQIDSILNAIDRAILQVEAYILKNS